MLTSFSPTCSAFETKSKRLQTSLLCWYFFIIWSSDCSNLHFTTEWFSDLDLTLVKYDYFLVIFDNFINVEYFLKQLGHKQKLSKALDQTNCQNSWYALKKVIINSKVETKLFLVLEDFIHKVNLTWIFYEFVIFWKPIVNKEFYSKDVF